MILPLMLAGCATSRPPIQDPKPQPYKWCTDSDFTATANLPEDVARAVLMAWSKYGTPSYTGAPLCIEVTRWPGGYRVRLHHRGQDDWTDRNVNDKGEEIGRAPADLPEGPG